jgi:hypothetical protein
VLSPDRLAQYEAKTDPKYLAISQLVQRFDFPRAATQRMVDVQNDISKRADAIRQDKSLTNADRSAQLAALGEEATTKASSIIGDEGLAAYKQGVGAWIDALKPPAT